MIQRTKLTEQFSRAIKERSWENCTEVCFKILYGLPSELQLELSCFIIRRYLSVFESKWPDIKWPRKILDDVGQWVTKRGRQVPEEPDNFDPADAVFAFCFDALLLSYYYRMNQATLTTSCVCAIVSAINAQKTNVWIIDDPEGVRMWEKQGYFPGRSVVENKAAIEMTEKEWTRVDEWIKEKKVTAYPDISDVEKMEKVLMRWKEFEMGLMVPKEK